MWLLLTCPLLGIWPATQACALDWESNQWPFGSQAGTQSTEPYQPGPKRFLKAFVSIWKKLIPRFQTSEVPEDTKTREGYFCLVGHFRHKERHKLEKCMDNTLGAQNIPALIWTYQEWSGLGTWICQCSKFFLPSYYVLCHWHLDRTGLTVGGPKQSPPWKGWIFTIKAIALKYVFLHDKLSQDWTSHQAARLGRTALAITEPRGPVTVPGASWQWAEISEAVWEGTDWAASLMQAWNFNSYSSFTIYTVSLGLMLMVTVYNSQIHSHNGCVWGAGMVEELLPLCPI